MTESNRLAGKVAVVTGAGSKGGTGIGAAMAIRFAQQGATVVILNRSADAGEETAAVIAANGGSCLSIRCDVASSSDCACAVAKTVSAFGRVDILVNNAAISRGGTIENSDEVWDAVMDVNLKGAMRMSRSAVSVMPRGGAIINISSRSGVLPPARGGLAYSTSKGALIALTRVMAVQLGGRGIRVNCVLVGNCWTPMAHRAMGDLSDVEVAAVRERRRLTSLLETEGTCWDVADAALFFASEESRWVTGQDLAVDGGFMLVGNPADPAYERGKPQLLG